MSIASGSLHAEGERIGRAFLTQVFDLWAELLATVPEGRRRTMCEAQGAMQVLMLGLLGPGGDHVARMYGIGVALGGGLGQLTECQAELMGSALEEGIKAGLDGALRDFSGAGRA